MKQVPVITKLHFTLHCFLSFHLKLKREKNEKENVDFHVPKKRAKLLVLNIFLCVIT